jgi:hypothetical protein
VKPHEREALIDLVGNKGVNIKKASKMVGITYSTAKLVIKQARNLAKEQDKQHFQYTLGALDGRMQLGNKRGYSEFSRTSLIQSLLTDSRVPLPETL